MWYHFFSILLYITGCIGSVAGVPGTLQWVPSDVCLTRQVLLFLKFCSSVVCPTYVVRPGDTLASISEESSFDIGMCLC